MPTIVTHGFVGVFFGKLFPWKTQPLRFWILTIFLPMLPDADVIAFFFHIPYDHVLGHRGFSHSFSFAILSASLVTTMFFTRELLISKTWWKYTLYFFIIIASHGILDALTNGGMGIAFWAPFENTRYFFPWRPLRVSPIGIMEFISYAGLKTAISELKWIWLPAGLLYTISFTIKHKMRKNTVSGTSSRK